MPTSTVSADLSVAAGRLFRVLADPTRLALMRRLAEGEASVGALVTAVGNPPQSPARDGTAQSLSNLRRAFQQLCDQAGLAGEEWTTYELRHSFVSLVADLVGHADTRTTQGYRHAVCPSLPHAITAWNRLLGRHEHGHRDT